MVTISEFETISGINRQYIQQARRQSKAYAQTIVEGFDKGFILPKKNKMDLEEIPQRIKKDLRFVFVETVDEALKAALSNKKR